MGKAVPKPANEGPMCCHVAGPRDHADAEVAGGGSGRGFWGRAVGGGPRRRLGGATTAAGAGGEAIGGSVKLGIRFSSPRPHPICPCAAS
jgi:hypothetical protein